MEDYTHSEEIKNLLAYEATRDQLKESDSDSWSSYYYDEARRLYSLISEKDIALWGRALATESREQTMNHFEKEYDSSDPVTYRHGPYSLDLYSLAKNGKHWPYTKAIVHTLAGEVVIYRNYSSFPKTWIMNHKSGHDYLICGEDYQGQTVVNLTTGEKVSWVDPGARNGVGFCWASILVSDNSDFLAVNGCYWGAGYEAWIVDFSEPMNLPYPLLKRFDYGDPIAWQGNKIIVGEYDIEYLRLHGFYHEIKGDLELSPYYSKLNRKRLNDVEELYNEFVELMIKKGHFKDLKEADEYLLRDCYFILEPFEVLSRDGELDASI